MSNIRERLLKKTCTYLLTSVNSSIKSSLFPSCVKFADVTPLHKKGRCKKNYRPVSILPILSKSYERSMFSKQQCGFRHFLVRNNVF